MVDKIQKLRIGIFISDPDRYLGKKIDFKVLASKLRSLPNVVTVQVRTDLADEKGLDFLSRTFREKKLKRFVIAAAAPWLHEELWGNRLEKAGLNRYLLATADLTGLECSTGKRKKQATLQAVEIITAAARRAAYLEKITREEIKPSAQVLVIGAGLAGLSAAKELAGRGYRVSLIEESGAVGGITKDLTGLYEDLPSLYAGDRLQPAALIETLKNEIERDRRIDLFLSTRIIKIRGQVGDFTAELTGPDGKRSVIFGAIVVAGGMKAVSPLPSLKLKESTPVILLSKAGHRINSLTAGKNTVSKIAFLMDVGKEQGVVTTGAVLNQALRARKAEREVTVLCKNIRVAAPGLEKLYREARENGIFFVKYRKTPKIEAVNGSVSVSVRDELMGEELRSNYDLLVVAEDYIAGDEALRKILRLKGDQENFLQEDNVWLYPNESSRRGIFITGACREPMTVSQVFEESAATAGAVDELLGEKTIAFDLATATIDEDKCVFCLTCYRVCPHGAIEMDFTRNVARVSEIACRACGICAAECPARAIQLRHYTDDQLAAEVGSPPQLLIFACEQSGVRAAAAAAELGWKFPPGTMMVRLPCAGKIDSALILNSLQKGAEKILILGCHRENCHYLQGSTRADKRVEEIKRRLQEAGLDPERVVLANLISKDGAKFRKYVEGCSV